VPGLDAENKKPCSQYCRALLYPYSGQKAKGEEKPEEELMGNVSLLRGWQQHLTFDVVIYIMTKIG